MNFSNAKYKKFSSLEAAAEFVGKTTAIKNEESSIQKKDRKIEKKPRERKGPRDSMSKVYVDGSCSGNGCKNSQGGIGVFWGDNDPRNLSEEVILPDNEVITNQKAELIVKQSLISRLL